MDCDIKYPDLGYILSRDMLTFIVKKSIYSDGYNIFLQLLTDARVSKDMLQTDLAQKLSKPQSFVSKAENGERRIDVYELYCICNAIGISMTDFIKKYESMLKLR